MDASEVPSRDDSPGTADVGPRRVVLKLGSRLLTGGGIELDPHRMTMIAGLTAEVTDTEVVIVTSGAVAAGFHHLGHTTPPKRIRDRQAAAAVGQSHLMNLWARAFQAVGRQVAQILLTRDCLTDRKRYVAARQALKTLLRAGIVPIVNENDTVSIEEIVVGDNDNLAAATAALVDATLLVLLTDVPGVLTGDPRTDPDARVIPYAESVDELRKVCFRKTSAESTGGMQTKLEAAETAGKYGVPTVIAAGEDPSVVRAVLRGERVGTFIDSDSSPLAAREHWMVAQKGLRGVLVVDDGAVRAIRGRASLLPSGIVRIEGRFREGDLVRVVDTAGVERARGIVRFEDRELERIRGLHTDRVRQELGEHRSRVVIRPDRMVLMDEEDEA